MNAVRVLKLRKRIPASPGNVVANYLDVEHLDFHSGLGGCEVVSETSTTACLRIRSRVGPWAWSNIHYYEFRPPGEIINATTSPIGPMVVQSRVMADPADATGASSVVDVSLRVELAWWAIPFWPVLREMLRRTNRRILEEDLQILRLRQQRFGNAVADYLSVHHRILFAAAFRSAFPTTTATAGVPT